MEKRYTRIHCPVCGALFKVEENALSAVCKFCGSSFEMDGEGHVTGGAWVGKGIGPETKSTKVHAAADAANAANPANAANAAEADKAISVETVSYTSDELETPQFKEQTKHMGSAFKNILAGVVGILLTCLIVLSILTLLTSRVNAAEVGTTGEATEVVTEATTEADTGKAERTGNENILLIGSDRRDTSWNGNSDTMILLTINHDVDKVFMTSFMRDLWADIPGVGVRKLNSAYAVGGAELLTETMENCYGVHIDHYAAVDFTGAENIIDALGGVTMDVTDDEANVTNDYITVLCQEKGVDPNPYYISGGEGIHLGGIQALAYMRNRFVGNNDFERTQRQRSVLEKLTKSINLTDFTDLKNLRDILFENVDTDFNTITLALLMAQIPSLKNYEMVSERIPYDDSYHSENEILIPNDLAATVERLRAEIYATE